MDERRNHNSDQSRLKVFVGLMAVIFTVTLALVIGNRLSDEALAVLAGAVCGVGAAIPTSLIIVMVSRRYDERTRSCAQPSMQHGVYPPVVVVAPPGGQQWSNDWNAYPYPLTAPTQRQFTVVGESQQGQQINTEVRSNGRYF
jgi:hypothetical protein